MYFIKTHAAHRKRVQQINRTMTSPADKLSLTDQDGLHRHPSSEDSEYSRNQGVDMAITSSGRGLQ